MFRWMCNVKPENRTSTEELRTRLNLKSLGTIYRIEDCGGLFIWKEGKRVLGLVNIELLRLVVVSPEDDPGKHGMR